MPVKDDLLWNPINKITKNNTEVTSETQKVSFIGSTPYKVNKNSDGDSSLLPLIFKKFSNMPLF